eukprot:GHVT01032785.1.p1 GENE.GHVT01032785.1~~GHVT01032785.1.p1  ORF type:complete len:917 (-),score=138.92 GHVT01032785.1:13-2709(-)
MQLPTGVSLCSAVPSRPETSLTTVSAAAITGGAPSHTDKGARQPEESPTQSKPILSHTRAHQAFQSPLKVASTVKTPPGRSPPRCVQSLSPSIAAAAATNSDDTAVSLERPILVPKTAVVDRDDVKPLAGIPEESEGTSLRSPAPSVGATYLRTVEMSLPDSCSSARFPGTTVCDLARCSAPLWTCPSPASSGGVSLWGSVKTLGVTPVRLRSAREGGGAEKEENSACSLAQAMQTPMVSDRDPGGIETLGPVDPPLSLREFIQISKFEQPPTQDRPDLCESNLTAVPSSSSSSVTCMCASSTSLSSPNACVHCSSFLPLLVAADDDVCSRLFANERLNQHPASVWRHRAFALAQQLLFDKMEYLCRVRDTAKRIVKNLQTEATRAQESPKHPRRTATVGLQERSTQAVARRRAAEDALQRQTEQLDTIRAAHKAMCLADEQQRSVLEATKLKKALLDFKKWRQQQQPQPCQLVGLLAASISPGGGELHYRFSAGVRSGCIPPKCNEQLKANGLKNHSHFPVSPYGHSHQQMESLQTDLELSFWRPSPTPTSRSCADFFESSQLLPRLQALRTDAGLAAAPSKHGMNLHSRRPCARRDSVPRSLLRHLLDSSISSSSASATSSSSSEDEPIAATRKPSARTKAASPLSGWHCSLQLKLAGCGSWAPLPAVEHAPLPFPDRPRVKRAIFRLAHEHLRTAVQTSGFFSTSRRMSHDSTDPVSFVQSEAHAARFSRTKDELASGSSAPMGDWRRFVTSVDRATFYKGPLHHAIATLAAEACQVSWAVCRLLAELTAVSKVALPHLSLGHAAGATPTGLFENSHGSRKLPNWLRIRVPLNPITLGASATAAGLLPLLLLVTVDTHTNPRSLRIFWGYWHMCGFKHSHGKYGCSGLASHRIHQ